MMTSFNKSKSDYSAKDDLTFDKKFKQLFQKREFLVPILANIVPEYKNCTLEQIEELICPHGDVKVNPSVYSSEDSGKGNEMTARYDVLVDCALPKGNGDVVVDFFFDLEMQRELNLEYPISKRGVYYCSRLLSRQIETLGEDSYNQLKSVYSVWILRHGVPKNLQNSVFTASLSGSFDRSTIDASILNDEINLIHLVMIYLSDGFDITVQNNLVKYLQSVFAKELANENRNPYYNYSKKIRQEVDEIMTIGESFRREGEIRGEIRGEIKGRIGFMLEDGKSHEEIVRHLMTKKKNPLTESQARKALQMYLKEN